ncbi:hypothetical protein [Streptomyces sp. NPDC003077]|uniref:hypothetical protein n=1 Tax=Streptomyces sp. NPDC003077 TaxID=3154443 RepID=UPI0033A4FDD3
MVGVTAQVFRRQAVDCLVGQLAEGGDQVGSQASRQVGVTVPQEGRTRIPVGAFGTSVGIPLGTLVGALAGTPVGALVGIPVGTLVSALVGGIVIVRGRVFHSAATYACRSSWGGNSRM